MSGTVPRISVVVPFYNVEKYLPECLDGLLTQSIPRSTYEIILVDNNSSDSSAAIASKYPEVQLLRQSVSGSYAARNMGIRAALGEIIATLDPDCRPDPDWLERIVEGMRDETAHVLLGHRRHAGTSESLTLLEQYEAEKITYVTDRGEKALFFGYTNNMAFRRALFDSIGLFSETMRGGDTIFVQRVVEELGPAAVRLTAHMMVTHLEVDTVNAYYYKRAVYGQSNERISQLMPFRPLTQGERWKVFKSLSQKHGFSLRKKTLLLALLVPGVLLYEIGRRRQMLMRPSH